MLSFKENYFKMAALHPNYKHHTFVTTNGEKIETRSTAHGKETALYIDIHTHPAWNKTKANYVNQNANEIAKFNNKFKGLDFLGKKA
jgi:large subunit ribosomal protein L31